MSYGSNDKLKPFEAEVARITKESDAKIDLCIKMKIMFQNLMISLGMVKRGLLKDLLRLRNIYMKKIKLIVINMLKYIEACLIAGFVIV